MKVEAIIPAAGLGLRLKSSLPGLPKPLVKLGGKPIIAHTLCALSASNTIKRIVIAVNKDHFDEFNEVLKRFPIKKRIDLVPGGATRRDSVENCLKTIESSADVILIHDAVRPFVSKDLITRLLKEAKARPAVICAVPVKATIKSVRCQVLGVRKEYAVEQTLNRENLWEIQTPQVFRKEVLIKAYKKYRDRTVTDDASLVEKLGVRVSVIYGSYFNIKITTADDLVFAKAILKETGNQLPETRK
jgi:2-C-methyl-D-erythritol 4-phosphate cytidylyltransferase